MGFTFGKSVKEPHSISKELIFNILQIIRVINEVYEKAVHIKYLILFLFNKRYFRIINCSKRSDLFGHFIKEYDFEFLSKTSSDLPYVSGVIKVTW